MKKKSILAPACGTLLAAGAIVFAATRGDEDERLSDFAKANIDALASSEIIVGPLCAYDPGRECETLGEIIPGYSRADR